MPPKKHTRRVLTPAQILSILNRRRQIAHIMKHKPMQLQKGRGNVSNLSGITNHHMSFPELLRGVY